MVLTPADSHHVGGLDVIVKNMSVDRGWLGDSTSETCNEAHKDSPHLWDESVSTGAVGWRYPRLQRSRLRHHHHPPRGTNACSLPSCMATTTSIMIVGGMGRGPSVLRGKAN